MKLSPLAVLLLNCGAVSAGIEKPHLSVSVRDGTFSPLEGLDPSVKWSTSGSAGDFDYEVGCDVAARATTDVASLPKSLFAKVGRNVAGWGLSARADVDLDVDSLDHADIDVQASNDDLDLELKVFATAGGTSSVNRLEISKGFDDVLDGKISVNPRYDVQSSSGDVVLSYDGEKTGAKLVASMDDQTLTVSRQITDDDTIAPSVSSSGDVSIQWKRDLDAGSITTTVKPKDSINVKWEDGAWTANIEAPMDGMSVEDMSVNVKRKIDFF
eukprot:CAMPEP_0197451260 /NCGR_PEP_ID=MMETSP1175-20131217/28266_1 /TAXON_ID=1003142 /ORGANISM="Triceratium dubium, Strain CCMP147" /LENGTH=269 /DNA_ID=CAMNT_0042983915 /DNA_START=89 /DNA_END=898 /DNA_ORIENTATION=-